MRAARILPFAFPDLNRVAGAAALLPAPLRAMAPETYDTRSTGGVILK